MNTSHRILRTFCVLGVLGYALLPRQGSAQSEKQTEGVVPGTRLPVKSNSVRFAVIGDSGTGDAQQHQVAKTMQSFHDKFPFEFVLMLGDNIYGANNPHGYKKKFEEPYKPLLDSGIKFYASLGNHDDPDQR